MLTGLWHGAAWNFIIWGLYFGIILLVEKHTVLKIKDKIPAPLLHVYSLAIIMVGWGIFYFDDMGNMERFFTIAFGQSGAPLFAFSDKSILFEKFWLLLAALLFCMPVRHHIGRLTAKICGEGSSTHLTVSTTAKVLTCCGILLLSVVLLIGATNNAFLYTRF